MHHFLPVYFLLILCFGQETATVSCLALDALYLSLFAESFDCHRDSKDFKSKVFGILK